MKKIFLIGLILFSVRLFPQVNTAPVTGIASRGFIIVSIAGNKVYKSIDGAISFHAEPGVTLSDVGNTICLDDDGYGFIAGNNGSAYRITPNGTSNFNYTLVQPEPVANIADDKGSNIPQVDLKQVTFTDRITGYLTTVTGLVLKTTDGGFHWKIQQNGGATAPVIAMKPGSKSETGILVDGNGNVTQLNDKSMTYGSRFWYDELGRVTLSQNAKQFYIEKYLTLSEEQQVPGNGTVRSYSYTLYDDIGRITEVGEVLSRATIPQFKFETQVQQSAAQSFITAGVQREITKTHYDIPVVGISLPSSFKQENLRPRVASVTYQAKESNNPADYDHATFFDYDSHGNIKTLLQDNALLGQVKPTERFKRIDYDYDLVSGKVNKVYYQKEKTDQLIHKYEYDGDNRIVKVFTSRDAITWDRDAQYDYYAHGPLAKMLLGNNNAEQNTYIYTIQGWIKGVNGNQFSYALGYFSINDTLDYKAINGSNQNLATPIANNSSLYNGNIATMASNTPKFADPSLGANASPALLTQQFRYDQLNRLIASNALAAVGQSSNMYKTAYAYDAGGNITNLKRFNAFGVQYDNMNYNYHNTDNNYNSNTNKLRSVDDDVVFKDVSTTDIDDQNVDNYQYDDIGNLIQDKQEQIDKIEWTVYGKIKSVTRTSGSIKADLEFTYDATGNRVSKLIKPRDVNGLRPQNEWTTTYYTRDATGIVMSTYEQADYNIKLSEQYVYGSSRVASLKPTTTSDSSIHTIGTKDFELIDHLGNVRVKLNDRSFSVDLGGDGIIDYYDPRVTSSIEYLPFGAPLRSFHSTSMRHTFNGKEFDPEIGTQDYGMRIYNYWLCKFLSVDPLTKQYPELTPYQFASNSPIGAIDLDGLEKIFYLGAFSSDGYSTLIKLLDKTKTYTESKKAFQDVNQNKGYNLIVIEGRTGSAGGETFTFTNEMLKSLLAAPDPKGAIAKALSGRVGEDQIDEAFIGALQETANQGRSMIFNVINKENVKDAEAPKFSLQRVLSRAKAAKSTAHELIAHAEETALQTRSSDPDHPEGDHEKYFGTRDNNGKLIDGGKDCLCGNGYSPAEGAEHKSSTAGKVSQEVDKQIEQENIK